MASAVVQWADNLELAWGHKANPRHVGILEALVLALLDEGCRVSRLNKALARALPQELVIEWGSEEGCCVCDDSPG